MYANRKTTMSNAAIVAITILGFSCVAALLFIIAGLYLERKSLRKELDFFEANQFNKDLFGRSAHYIILDDPMPMPHDPMSKDQKKKLMEFLERGLHERLKKAKRNAENEVNK